MLGSGGVLGFAWLLGALVGARGRGRASTRASRAGRHRDVGRLGRGGAARLRAVGRRDRAGTTRACPAPQDPVLAYDYGTGVGDGTPPRPGLATGLPAAGLGRAAASRPGVADHGPDRAAAAGARLARLGARAGRRAWRTATGIGRSWPTAPRPWIVAADQRSGRRIVFGRDDLPPDADGRPRPVRTARLADAVQASCSIPGWYPPVVIDGVPYVDGGAVSICSIDLLLGPRRHGRRHRRGVRPGADGRRRSRPADGHRGAARAAGAQAGHRTDPDRRRAAARRRQAGVPADPRPGGARDDGSEHDAPAPAHGGARGRARAGAATQLRRDLAASAGWGRRA